MQSYLSGTMKQLDAAISQFKGKYLGQDEIEEDGTGPEKAENKPHVGEKIEAESGKPVDPEKNIKHVGDKIDEKTGKPVKPEGNLKHQEPKTKELHKAQSPVKADNKPHVGDMPYGEKGTEVPVQSGIKTESKDSLKGKELSSGIEQFASSDIESKIGHKPTVGDKFFHDGFRWKVVKVDNVGNVDALAESKGNLEESKKDLMDLAKQNADNREDWVMATVSAAIFYAMGRAPGEMYNALKDSPELFYSANEKIRSGELKANPCDIADWLKDQVGDKGIEGDFKEPLDVVEPTEPVTPVAPASDEPDSALQDEKKK
jgi:hypothetical protein